MSQLALDYGIADKARAMHRALLDILRSVVARVSLKEVAFMLDTSPSMVADALAERERKGVRLEWLPVLLGVADDGEREEILKLLADPFGFTVQRRRKLTPTERLRVIEARLVKKFGEAGEQFLDEVES